MVSVSVHWKSSPSHTWQRFPPQIEKGGAGCRNPKHGVSTAAAVALAAGGATQGVLTAASKSRRRRFPGRRGMHAGLRCRNPGVLLDLSAGGTLSHWTGLYINLKRRVDRVHNLANVFFESGNLPFWKRLRRVDAVDGRQLNFEDDEVQQVVYPTALEAAKKAERSGFHTIIYDESCQGELVQFDDHLTRGGIACALSHRKALKELANDPKADWGLILEDDITAMVPNVDREIAAVLNSLPADWDALFLGYHHGCGSLALQLDDRPARTLEVGNNVYGLYAWIVRKEVARQLAARAFPINSQVDGAISSWLMRNRKRVFQVRWDEMLFYSPPSEIGQDSDVQTMAPLGMVLRHFGSIESYREMCRRPRGMTTSWHRCADLDHMNEDELEEVYCDMYNARENELYEDLYQYDM